MLAQAISGMDRCERSVPLLTQSFVRAPDGWATELKLAKGTTSGDLPEKIRRWTNVDCVVIKSKISLWLQ